MEASALLAAELSAPFERASESDAASIVERHWGITPARVNRVDTERDDTFRVETAEGSYALKIAHPADDPAAIDLQTSAIEWAAERDPSLPVPRPIATVDGTRHPVVEGRIVRLFPWMPGQSLRAGIWDAAPERPLLHSVGATQARLTAALAGFRHPAESRALAWDVARLPELVGLTDALDDPIPIAAVLDRHLAEIAPRLATLPQQLIHNDGNLDNLLVDDRATRVVAVLDFGDAVRTARVLDLAVVASYLLPADDQYAASDVLDGLIAGWESVLPLDPDERALLPRLVIARLVQRMLLGSWLSREVAHNADYLGRNIAHTRAQFDLAMSTLDLRERW